MIDLTQLNTKLFINGEWHKTNDEMPIINPTDQSIITFVSKANRNDVNNAVNSAKAAFPSWASLGIKKRINYIEKFREAISKNKNWLATIESLNSGNPIKGMYRDVDNVLARIDQSIHFASSVNGFTRESSDTSNLHYIKYEPYGVVARIVPFNHPLLFAATKIIPPLLMGNTILLKPSDYTPLSALALGGLIQEIFPPGVINIITGDFNAGSAIVQHPLIKRIGFTGSSATGQKILEDAAKVGIKNISLELGGKNPMIVFPDADVPKAAKYSLIGMGYGSVQGQSCGSNSRVFIHDSIYEEFVEELCEKSKELVLGDPLDENTDIGPLISQKHLEFVQSKIEEAKREGAKVLYGGTRPSDEKGERGNFLVPAILTNVSQDMKVAKEEIFGPVMALFRWKDYDQLIGDVNDIDYGLTASIWTKDLNLAHKTANVIEAGYIWINHTAKHFDGLPFGGYKNSGLGREESIDEMLSYCETKVINLILED
ncbi:aldehyde dehydrogenase family protein [Mesobacillus harenae]|uniref:aldehyde dehydrogenase family protein n=1 Tax=Mesobacillus harenae TaxID=2213203 RepID=UPI002410C2B0|nr:aldehyde dehydrogenase family protein [Mesobacillus harenae]